MCLINMAHLVICVLKFKDLKTETTGSAFILASAEGQLDPKVTSSGAALFCALYFLLDNSLFVLNSSMFVAINQSSEFT